MRRSGAAGRAAHDGADPVERGSPGGRVRLREARADLLPQRPDERLAKRRAVRVRQAVRGVARAEVAEGPLARMGVVEPGDREAEGAHEHRALRVEVVREEGPQERVEREEILVERPPDAPRDGPETVEALLDEGDLVAGHSSDHVTAPRGRPTARARLRRGTGEAPE